MKLALIITVLFFFSTNYSIESRELKTEEKVILLSLDKHLVITDYLTQKIEPSHLSITDKVKYNLLKAACLPADAYRTRIENADDSLKSQVVILYQLTQMCKSGIIELMNMYRIQDLGI